MRRVLCWALAYSAAIYGGNFAAEASKDAASARAEMQGFLRELEANTAVVQQPDAGGEELPNAP